MTKALRNWLARVKVIQQEWKFLDKPGKPVEIRDAEGNLHCETGPAVVSHTHIAHYENGRRHGIHATRFGSLVYHFKGVLVPPSYILTPEKLTFEQVMKHPNAEVRRVGCEVYGFERMEKEGRFEVIHEDPEMQAKLYKATFKNDDEPLVLVKVLDGTPDPKTGERKVYTLPVPPDTQRCRQAVAWTFRKEENEYNPSIER